VPHWHAPHLYVCCCIVILMCSNICYCPVVILLCCYTVVLLYFLVVMYCCVFILLCCYCIIYCCVAILLWCYIYVLLSISLDRVQNDATSIFKLWVWILYDFIVEPIPPNTKVGELTLSFPQMCGLSRIQFPCTNCPFSHTSFDVAASIIFWNLRIGLWHTFSTHFVWGLRSRFSTR
jgi:hypothetical protein